MLGRQQIAGIENAVSELFKNAHDAYPIGGAKSRIENMAAGPADLLEVIRRDNFGSIAIPALGCGNGGLDRNDVRPRILRALRIAGRSDIGLPARYSATRL